MAFKRKRLFVIFLFGCILTVTATISLSYAWLIFEKNTEPIDAVSSGIKYVYEINDEMKTQSTTYTISNLAFFDIDEEKEINYYLDMACLITLEVRNTGDTDIVYTISQTTGKHTEAAPGVLCLFTTRPLTESDITYTTIQEMVDNTSNLITESVSGELVKYDITNSYADSITCYVYIIGVQPDDAANNDFLNETYDFTIEINTHN